MTAEVELYQPKAEVVLASDIDSWTRVASQVIKLANEIYDTPFVPDGLRGSVPATAAAILSGRELGLGPMTSLANIHVIKGKPALSAALMRALILAQGHQIETVDISDTRAVVRGRRKGEANWEEAAFTADQARKANIQLGGYPQDKLYARATSRLARRKFADVIAGMPYSAEELEDGEENGTAAVEPAAATEGPKPRTAQRKQRTTDAPPAQPHTPPNAAASPVIPVPAERAGGALPPLPGEDEDPTRPAAPAATSPATGSSTAPAADGHSEPGTERHRKLVGVVRGHFKRLGFRDGEDDAERLTATAVIARVKFDLQSTNELDEDELKTVADTIARCRDRDALTALIVAADKEAGDGN